MRLRRVLALSLALIGTLANYAAETPPLVLISLDGFRWDYGALHPAETPHLRRLMSEGVTARSLIERTVEMAKSTPAPRDTGSFERAFSA